jgi:hypothetical protein
LSSKQVFHEIVNNKLSEDLNNFLGSLWNLQDVADCIGILMSKYRKRSSHLEDLLNEIEDDFRPRDIRRVEDHVVIEFESYNPSKVSRKREKREYERYRKAGFLERDIDLLKQIRRRR